MVQETYEHISTVTLSLSQTYGTFVDPNRNSGKAKLTNNKAESEVVGCTHMYGL